MPQENRMSRLIITEIRKNNPDAPKIELPDGTLFSVAVVPFSVIVDVEADKNSLTSPKTCESMLRRIITASDPEADPTRIISQLRIDEITSALIYAITEDAKRIRELYGKSSAEA
jgi:hypothetical protein